MKPLFRPLYCLSFFDLRLLITPLVSSNIFYAECSMILILYCLPLRHIHIPYITQYNYWCSNNITPLIYMYMVSSTLMYYLYIHNFTPVHLSIAFFNVCFNSKISQMYEILVHLYWSFHSIIVSKLFIASTFSFYHMVGCGTFIYQYTYDLIYIWLY